MIKIINSTSEKRDINDIIASISGSNKTLPTFLLYDTMGSKLFDLICETKEYYLTREEAKILDLYSNEIVKKSDPLEVFELGSGSSRKTDKILSSCCENSLQVSYSAFDISEKALFMSNDRLKEKFKNLIINLYLGDYLHDLNSIPESKGNRLILFLGSTLGNFSTIKSMTFLSQIARIMKENDFLLLGFDKVKSLDLMESAYNDSEGITKKFNLNILNVMNNNYNTNFDLNNFEHSAKYNSKKNQIEMYLISNKKHSVTFPKQEKLVEIGMGEKILTEISKKFTNSSIESIVDKAELKIESFYELEDRKFSLALIRKEE